MDDLASPSAGFAIDEGAISASLARIYKGMSGNEVAPELFNATAKSIRHAAANGVNNAVNAGVPIPSKEFLGQMKHSADLFSAFKTHSQQRAIGALITGENGKRRSFSEFRRASEPLVGKYNRNWLRTEYNTAVRRSNLATNWQQYEAEKDVMPCLEWVESTSPNPGADHSIFWGTVQPVDAPFWNEHAPGDRWNCQCSLEQTDKNPTIAPSADSKSVPQPGLDNNPGSDGKLFNNSHPYFPKSCSACPFPKNKLAALFHALSDDRDCHNCSAANNAIEKASGVVTPSKDDINKYGKLDETGKFHIDKEKGENLLISVIADKTEIADNIYTARTILNSFPSLKIEIAEHILSNGHKNPEYRINGLIADAKRIKGENGVTNGFVKAIKQGCKVVILDLNKSMKGNFNTQKLRLKLGMRHADFDNNTIKSCYVVANNKAIKIDKDMIRNQETINNELLKIRKP